MQKILVTETVEGGPDRVILQHEREKLDEKAIIRATFGLDGHKSRASRTRPASGEQQGSIL